MFNDFLKILAFTSLLGGCHDNKPGFSGPTQSKPIAAAPAVVANEGTVGIMAEPEPQPAKSGSIKTVAFTFSGMVNKEHSADYLLIIDNSASMLPFVDKMKASLLAIPESAFSKKGRIAVMSTMVGDYTDLTKVSPSINAYPGIHLEPGFLSLVSAAAIKRFLDDPTLPAEKKTGFTRKGCSDAWFRPFQKNEQGELCLDGAAQFPYHGVGCEAGINALGQFFEKNKGTPLFRSGSFLHVIYIADEPHPGCKPSETKPLLPANVAKTEIFAKCPDFKTINNAAMENSDITGLKIHGIVNLEKHATYSETCNYKNLITAAGGEMLDINVATDYSSVIDKILVSTPVTAPSYQFSAMPSAIQEVRANAAPVDATDITLSPSGLLQIRGLEGNVEQRIEIDYLE